jgi:hypothetical protein
MIKILPNGNKVAFDGVYYDFRDAEGVQMLKLWTPPDRSMRGIFISGHGGGTGDSRDFARDLNFRAFAARLGFGVAGLHSFPGRHVYETGGKVFFDALDEFAALEHHPELANVPFCIFGSSNGGATAYGFACYAPERAICFVSNVCSWYNPTEPSDAALEVPGMLIVGMFDPFCKEMVGAEKTIAQVNTARARGGRWSAVVAQKGHEDGYAFDAYVKLCEQCIPLRYPDTEDPAAGPVALRSIPESDGWLVDHGSWDSGLTKVAPFNDYTGDKAVAGWVPNEHIAYIYRAVATYDNPVSLSVDGVEAVHNPHNDPQTMFSIGGPVVDAGKELKLRADLWEFGSWQKLVFYEGADRLGEVLSPSAPEFAVPADIDSTMKCFTVEAQDSGGVVRTSPPFYVVIRDPALLLEAAPSSSDMTVLERVGPDAGEDSRTITASGGPVLTAPALSAQHEQQFDAQDGRVAPFWADVRDAVRMTPAENKAEGSAFSRVNTQDALLCVKAAHSASGLYLYLEVTDDCFLECNPSHYHETDAVDLMIDSRPSSAITDPANDTQLINQAWGLSLTVKQIQVACGDRQRPPFFLQNYADPWDFVPHRDTFAEARERYGIVIRHVRLNRRVRVQEWFLPWAQVGHGDLTRAPKIGEKLAFTASYSDKDDPAGPVKKLILDGGDNPWEHGAGAEGSRGWGDIKMGGAL